MIDVHAHLGKVMYGIEKSVILPLVAPEEEDYLTTSV